ncbi:MAG TPA: peptide chain release factor N(5)-glutamine methyltransferase [bacterium]|nr:peptide chain release factor N(5)-glutamine methyltransferase [bacterium]
MNSRAYRRCSGAPPGLADASTRRAALACGEARLRAAGVAGDEACLEAEVLLRHAAGLSREELLVRPHGVLPQDTAREYAALIARRAAGWPTAYLVGHREFFGIDLLVDERVLIPRPETERLVEVVCDALRTRPAPVAADIGTGSGAIAIALARLLPALRVIGTDVAAGCLEVAHRNAVRAGVEGRIVWTEGAGTTPLEGRASMRCVDAIVSNPPYIPTAQLAGLPVEIRAHEPVTAIDGGPDGLTVHRQIVAGAVRCLSPGGILALEVSAVDDQARAVCALIEETGGYETPSIVPDYAGADRVVLARRGGRDADFRG